MKRTSIFEKNTTMKFFYKTLYSKRKWSILLLFNSTIIIQNGTSSLVNSIQSESDNIDLFHLFADRCLVNTAKIYNLSSLIKSRVSEQRLGPSIVEEIFPRQTRVHTSSNRKYITIVVEFRIRSNVRRDRFQYVGNTFIKRLLLENDTGQRAIREIVVMHDLQPIC